MQLTDLLKERLDVENQDAWVTERTPTPVRCFAVRIHSIGLLLPEIPTVFDCIGVDRCHQAIWNWKETPDETQSEVDGDKKWLYAAIDAESKLLFGVAVFSRPGQTPRRSRERGSREHIRNLDL
jgi:hypothetical protein